MTSRGLKSSDMADRGALTAMVLCFALFQRRTGFALRICSIPC